MEYKLVLFDIDGTLIRHSDSHVSSSWSRFVYAAEKVYGVKVTTGPSIKYHGLTDQAILFDVVGQFGISESSFLAKFPEAIKAMREAAQKQTESGITYYNAIPEAIQLAKLLTDRGFLVGLLTGNVLPMAHWKIEHAKIDKHLFKLWLTGDEFLDRKALARTVFGESEKKLGKKFLPGEIVVVGDAPGDVQCARAIGVKVIIATTGGHLTKEELAKLNPDLLVDSLMDPLVLQFFGL